MNHPPNRTAAGAWDIPSVLAVLREGIQVLRSSSFRAIAAREEQIRCLSDLVEEIELDETIPKLNPLERGALNTVLRCFRFY